VTETLYHSHCSLFAFVYTLLFVLLLTVQIVQSRAHPPSPLLYYNTTMSRTMHRLVRLITMIVMLVAPASARLAITEQKEEDGNSVKMLSGCDTGAACGCPDHFTKLFFLDVPTVCVPLEVSNVIFLVFVPFLTCCATPLPTFAPSASPIASPRDA
jgi:hypothetical protein